MRKPTQIGVAPPSQVNKRPSGRYSFQAPEVPVGSILRVKTREGSTRFVEVAAPHGERVFVGLDGDLVDFVDWDYASRVDVETFRFEQHISRCADDVELRGVPSFAAKTRDLPPSLRHELFKAVADELQLRGKAGKATQVLAYLEES